jgi:hypothetical protein
VVAEIRIHYEGDAQLKEGFRRFFAELVSLANARNDCRVQFIDGAGRETAIHDFRLALKTHPASWNVLLIDSEGPDDGNLFRPLGLTAAQRESVFWMVQMMESWFLADVQALKGYYGQGFRESSLRGDPNVERISKRDVMRRLANATGRTQKGKYDKVDHAPHLLRKIDPALVQKAAPNCLRIFEIFRSRLQKS